MPWVVSIWQSIYQLMRGSVSRRVRPVRVLHSFLLWLWLDNLRLKFSERDKLQAEVSNIRLQASLLPGGRELSAPVPVRTESWPRETQVCLLAGAHVLHPREGQHQTAAQHFAPEGQGNRISVQGRAGDHVPSFMVWNSIRASWGHG